MRMETLSARRDDEVGAGEGSVGVIVKWRKKLRAIERRA